MHLYEVRPRKDHRGVDLISDALPFGRVWYDTPDHAIGYAMHSSRLHDAVIRVYDDAGNVIETHRHKGDFREPRKAGAHNETLPSRWAIFVKPVQSTGRHKSPFLIPETQSVFHLHGQRNAFRRRDARQQSRLR
jgi:hypothetical protein